MTVKEKKARKRMIKRCGYINSVIEQARMDEGLPQLFRRSKLAKRMYRRQVQEIKRRERLKANTGRGEALRQAARQGG